MSWIEKWLTRRIVSFFERKGLNVVIGKLKFGGVNKLTISDIKLEKDGEEGQYIKIEKIVLRLSFWRSIANLAVEGEICLEGVFLCLNIISEDKIEIKTIDTAFRLGWKQKIAQVEIDAIQFSFQYEHKKSNDEFYVQLSSTKWDDLIAPIRAHLLSGLVKEAHSTSEISLLAYLKKDKNSELPAFFNAKITAPNFLLEYPEAEYSKVDGDYLKKTLEDKLKVSYVAFDHLPKYMTEAFICTEDPLFWQHSGISPYFIGYAISANLKSKKIVRGASTITMQVARNIFLTHQRTVIRKIEEGIIALLLENHFKIDKKIIFELYANLIEFAPDVYGVADASRFYFGKNLSKLSLTEILVLSYIIPRPKHFYDALLDKTEQLQRNLYNHIYSYALTMLQKGFIDQIEYQSIDYTIRFAEPFGELNLSVDRISDFSNG